ncbi:MAG TPA: hypothetical protein PLU30_10815 [Verrucomicrobiae bacterium]|nr:hypothetical protein [Verrucomicrobiae bacterium]
MRRRSLLAGDSNRAQARSYTTLSRSVSAALLAITLFAGCAKRETPPPPPPPPPEQSFDPGGHITGWMVCGPWPISGAPTLSREALQIDFLGPIGGEAAADPTPGARCGWGQAELSFRQTTADADGIDLALHTAGTEGIVYLATRIRSDAPRRAFFHLETRQALRVWCNGHEVFTVAEETGKAHFHAFESKLASGVNRLLLKIVVASSPGHVCLKMADEAGHRHALAAAAIRQTDTGILRASIEQTGEAGECLALRTRFPFDTLGVFDDLTANWSVSSPEGAIEWKGTATLRESSEAKLPAKEGFHRLRLEVPGLLADPIVVERTLLTSKDPAGLRSRTVARAEALIADPARSRYAGRLSEALDGLRHSQPEDNSALMALEERIRETESNPLPARHGSITWAFRSTIDASGQTFRMNVPEGYRPDYRHPLHLRLTSDASEPDDLAFAELWRDAFVVWPGRRAIESGGRGIGARDILDAIDFTTRHWSIDERRIYISGDGWPGAAAWRLAARYPDRFSALRIAGSPAPETPVENLSRVPVFSTHAEEDPRIPWWLSRVPLRALSRTGGFAVAHDIVEKDGDGSRMRQEIGAGIHWERSQRSPVPADRIQFVAQDGSSRGAYWAEVLEWQDGAEPARWLARCSRDNGLFIDARNTAVMRIDLTHAPLDLQRPVRITINGRRQGIADPPFGGGIYLSLSSEFLRVTSRPPSTVKGHPYRPCDPALSTEVEPLLIVRGTRGGPEIKASIRLAAERLTRMPAPTLGPGPAPGPKPIWSTKDDSEVSDADLARFNLLLLGGPEQNGLVARIAANLPVKCEADQITTPAGRALATTARAWWLHYPNPLGPGREVFIAASADPAFYTAGMPAATAVRGRSPFPDFMLWSNDGHTLATAGFFGSGWEWVPPRRSGVLPENLCSAKGWGEFQAAALARAGAADFTVLPRDDAEQPPPLFAPGEATWGDALACVPDCPIWRFTIAYRELARIRDRARTSTVGEAGADVCLYPDAETTPEGRGRCRVVAPSAPLAARFLHTAASRVDDADFAGEGTRAAIEWAVDAAPGPAPQAR